MSEEHRDVYDVLLKSYRLQEERRKRKPSVLRQSVEPAEKPKRRGRPPRAAVEEQG